MDTFKSLPLHHEIVAFQSPFLISYTAAINGYAPQFDMQQSFRYCDLGCSDGCTLLALAAIYPKGEFIGIDSDESLLSQARQSAEQLGLDNIQFIQADYTSITQQSLPPFDFISISYVYSYVDDIVAKQLLLFSQQHLKDQGFLHINYLCSPGQANIEPVSRLLHVLNSSETERYPDKKSKSGLDLLRKLAKRGMGFLNKNPLAIEAIRKYLVSPNVTEDECLRFSQDVLSQKFYPRYFDQVYDAMRLNELEFAGSCDYALNDPEICIPSAQIPTFREIDSIREQELLKDFVLNSKNRHDVYVKGNVKDIKAASLWLRDHCSLLSRQAKAAIKRMILTNSGQRIPMQSIAFNELIDAADESIADLPSLSNWQNEPLRYSRAMNRLLASGQYFLCQSVCQIEPLFEPEKMTLSSFNHWNLQQSYEAMTETRLISEKTGGVAIVLDVIETMVLYTALRWGWQDCVPRVLAEAQSDRVTMRYKKMMELTEADIQKIVDSLTMGQKAKNLMRLGIYCQ